MGFSATAAALAVSAHRMEERGGMLQDHQGSPRDRREDAALLGGGSGRPADLRQLRSRYEQYRAAGKELLDEPDSSLAASLVSVFLTTCIVVSTTASIVETIPEVGAEFEGALSAMEVIFTFIFSAEILARVWTADSCASYACSLSNVIDLVVTVPWYFEQLYSAVASAASDRRHSSLGTLRTLRLVRMVRLLRVLRIAKAARQSRILKTVFESVTEAWAGFFILTAMMGFASVVSATLMYAVESDVPNGSFVSIPISMWWAITTITTVGYGDMYPITALGKLVACVTMVVGILIVSVSVAIITTTFTEAYERRIESDKRSSAGSWRGMHSETNSTVGDLSRQASELHAELHAECDVMRAVEDIERVSSELLLELEGLAAAGAEFPPPGGGGGARWGEEAPPPNYALLMARGCRVHRDAFLRVVTDLAEHLRAQPQGLDDQLGLLGPL